MDYSTKRSCSVSPGPSQLRDAQQPTNVRQALVKEELTQQEARKLGILSTLHVECTPGILQAIGDVVSVLKTPGYHTVYTMPKEDLRANLGLVNINKVTEAMDCSVIAPSLTWRPEPNIVTVDGAEGIPQVVLERNIHSSASITPNLFDSPKAVSHENSEWDKDYNEEFDLDAFENTSTETERKRDYPPVEEIPDYAVGEFICEMEEAMDRELDKLNGLATDYNWISDFDKFIAVKEKFSGPTPGAIKEYSTPYEAFIDIWDHEIMNILVTETNRYANQTLANLKSTNRLDTSGRFSRWRDTDEDELYVLLAVFMYFGMIGPSRTIQSCWSVGTTLEMPRFRKVMPYNRYVLLSKCFNFVDNLNNTQFILSPKLKSLEPIIIHLNKKFSSLYNLQPDISMDESLTLFKGRLSWIQAVKAKAARFGIKSFELCEAKTGYLYKFYIYTGKDSKVSISLSADLGGKTTKVVLTLLKGLEHRGHCVTMDNFYNSPALARYLKCQGFDCLGTLRVNRKNVPIDIAKLPKNVPKGTIAARHCGDVSVLAWKDSRLMTMISTYHGNTVCVEKKAEHVIIKPESVITYNRTMCGIDLKDQKLSMYVLDRKRGLKWYVKMFKRLLNVSIHNAFILLQSSLSRRNMRVMTYRKFREELADALTKRHQKHHHSIKVREPVSSQLRLRTDISHFPTYTSGAKNRKRCAVCFLKGKTQLVHGSCVTCNVFLCLPDCYRVYHTQMELEQRVGRKSRKRKRDQ